MPSSSAPSSASRNVLSPEDVRTNAQALVAEGRTDEAFDLFVAALGAVLVMAAFIVYALWSSGHLF